MEWLSVKRLSKLRQLRRERPDEEVSKAIYGLNSLFTFQGFEVLQGFGETLEQTEGFLSIGPVWMIGNRSAELSLKFPNGRKILTDVCLRLECPVTERGTQRQTHLFNGFKLRFLPFRDEIAQAEYLADLGELFQSSP